MATTYTYKNGDGVQATTYPFTFPYIKDTDVKVEVLESGAWVTKTKDTHYEFANATSIRFKTDNVPSAATNNIKISRATDADKLTATFYPGSAIRSVDLNENFTQNLYSTEESKETGNDAQLATDALVGVTYDGGTTWTQTGDGVGSNPKGVKYAVTEADAAVDKSTTVETLVHTYVHDGTNLQGDGQGSNPKGVKYAVDQVETYVHDGTGPQGDGVGSNPKGLKYAIDTADTAQEATDTVVATKSGSTWTLQGDGVGSNPKGVKYAVETAEAAFQRDGSATMTGNIVFEGASDDAHETTLTVQDPGQDNTIKLPDVSGTVPVLAVHSDTQITSTPEELNILDGVTANKDEINILDGVTANKDELNVLDGIPGTLTATELGYVDGVTSAIQTQVDGKQADATTLTTMSSMHGTTATRLSENVALTSTIGKLNLLSDKTIETSVSGTSTDTQIPTAKAVNDQIINIVDKIGGFIPIADELKFPNNHPDPEKKAGTIVSIADAGGLKVADGSGSGDYAGTAGHSIGATTVGTTAVTIKGIPSTLHGTTLGVGQGMLVETTEQTDTEYDAGPEYNYHRLVLDEADVTTAADLVSDFNERYRVSTDPDSLGSKDDGDLVFDTTDNVMKVYNATDSEWQNVSASGDFRRLYLSEEGSTNAPTLDGTENTFDLRKNSNSGAVASISRAEALLVSVNGVLQEPNSGTSIGSNDGFCLKENHVIQFGDNLPSNADVFVVEMAQLQINEPADDSVTSAMLKDNIDIRGTFDVTGVTTFDSDVRVPATVVGGVVTSKKLIFEDGANDDWNPGGFEISYKGAGNLSTYGSNNINFETDSGDILFQSDMSGSGSNMAAFNAGGACILYHDGSQRLATTNVAVDVTGILTTSGGVNVGNTTQISESDAGSGSYNTLIQNGTNGDIVIRGAELLIQDKNSTNEAWIQCGPVATGGVKLNHVASDTASTKLETTSTGVTVTGNSTVGSFVAATADSNGGQLKSDGNLLLNKNGGEAITIYNNSATKTCTIGADGDLFINASDGTNKAKILNDGTATFTDTTVVGSTPDWANATSAGIGLYPAAATNWIGIKNSSGSTASNTAFQVTYGTDTSAYILNDGRAWFRGEVTFDNETGLQSKYITVARTADDGGEIDDPNNIVELYCQSDGGLTRGLKIGAISGTSTTPGNQFVYDSIHPNGAHYFNIEEKMRFAVYKDHSAFFSGTAWDEVASIDDEGNAQFDGDVGIGLTISDDYGAGHRVVQIHSGSTANSYLALTNTTTGDQGADNGLNLVQAGVNAYVNNRSAGSLIFSTNDLQRVYIDSFGEVSVGSATWGVDNAGIGLGSGGWFYANRAGGPCGTFTRDTNDGDVIEIRQGTTKEGSISVSGSTVSFNGGHLSRWSQLPSAAERTQILRGSVLSNLDEMCEWGTEDNEQLNRMKVSDVEGDKNVSGVFQSWDDDDDTYKNDFYCAMTGDFVIRIAQGTTVSRGDLLMSAGDGTAKPQDDDIIRSKTIAKVTSTVVSETYSDNSYCVPCVLMAC